MNRYRTLEQARRLWLDSIAFDLHLKAAKRPCPIISEIASKSCAAHVAIQKEKYKVAKKHVEEILAISIEYKTRREKDALCFLKLCNLAGEVVRGLK